MISNVTVEGGFDPVTWEKTNSQATVIYRNSSNMQSSPNRLVGISCVGISNFRLQDLMINIDDAIGSGVSTYGIHVDSCSNYSITRCIVNAGNGSDGIAGVPGTDGVNGVAGAGGQNGDEDEIGRAHV